MALVLDTGVLYGALDSDDLRHDVCASLIEGADEQLVVPVPVLVELDYWVRKFASADAWLAFCEDVNAGAYSLLELDATALLRAAQLQSQYADPPLDITDAAVFIACEALGEEKVATLDRRHFSVLRTTEGKSLQLLPELDG